MSRTSNYPRSTFPAPRSLRSWLILPHVLGLALVLAYLLRSSILMILVPGSGSPTTVATYAILGIGFVYLLTSAGGIGFPGMLFLLACLPGSLLSAATATAIPKYGGWALLVLVAGPLLLGERAWRLRRGAWTSVVMLTALVGAASCLWWVLRLPVLGRGAFCGVMTHANTVGPIAGLAMVLAASKVFSTVKQERLIWLAVTGASLIPCVASASRISVMGAAAGLAVVCLVEWKKLMEHLMVFVLMGLLLAGGGYAMLMKSETATNVTEALAEKGDVNTREVLWQARLEEFKSHQYWGIGVGYGVGGEEEGVVEEDGKVNVEPGSSYLAILSMTGLSGAIGMAILLLWAAGKWFGRFRFLPPGEASQLMGAGVFLGVNGIAEGWVLAVGSPLCLIFWLWLGRLVDAVQRTDGGGGGRWKPETGNLKPESGNLKPETGKLKPES